MTEGNYSNVGHRGPVYKGLGAMNPCDLSIYLYRGIETEGQVEEDGQETSGGGGISTFSENVNEETIKNTSIDLLSTYWEAMQNKSQIGNG
jgi:hypothetical protein